MENYIIQTLDETKIHFDLATMIRILVVLVLTVAALIALSILHKRLRSRPGIADDIRKKHNLRIIFSIVMILVSVMGAFAALQTGGINLTGMTALISLLILLLALAVKDALQDVFAGFVIVSDKFFSVGDAVEYEGKEGIVVSFTARTTKIELLDDRSVLAVANRNISQIRKMTHQLDLDVPLPYELPSNDALTILSGITDQIRGIDGVEKCALKGMQSYEASAILYKIRLFCEPCDMPDIRRAALKTIQDGLEAASIQVPYQQVDIHSR